MLLEPCILCDDAPGVDEHGYCLFCHLAVKAEVREGLRQLTGYVAAWAEFADWCAVHEVAS